MKFTCIALRAPSILTLVLTLAALPSVPSAVAAAPAVKPAGCGSQYGRLVRSFRIFGDEVKQYWRKQIPYVDLAPPLLAEKRITKTIDFVLKNGVKVAFAPTITAIDMARALPRANRARKENGQTFHRFLFVPMDIAQRNGPHLAAYAALTAVGIHATNVTSLETWMKDYDAVRPTALDLKDDELAVVILPEKPDDFFFKLVDQIKQAYRDRGIPADRIRTIQAQSDRDLFRQLDELRNVGRVRDIHWLGHGSPGSLLIGADESNEGAVIEDVGEMAYLTPRRPAGLIAPDARLTLYSCDLARGVRGRNFVKELGAFTLGGQGTVIASTQTFNPTFDIAGFKERLRHPDGSLNDPMYHAVLAPAVTAVAGFVGLKGFLKGGAAGPDPVIKIDLRRASSEK